MVNPLLAALLCALLAQVQVALAEGSRDIVDEISSCWQDRFCLVVAVRPIPPYALYADPSLSVSFNCTSGSCSNVTGLSIELWDTLLTIANEGKSSAEFGHKPLRYVISA